jgi:hypothetical protein
MSRGSRKGRPGRSRRAGLKALKPSGEGLEPRALPSASPLSSSGLLPSKGLTSILFPTPPPLNPLPRSAFHVSPTNGRVEGLYQLSLKSHPLYQSVGTGHVVKAPMFTAAYKGPKRNDLDVVAASAWATAQQGLALTGQVLGPIDASQPAAYRFLINRGGAGAPGPIRIRPRIVLDAEVTVTTGPQGVAGSVTLVDAQGRALSTVGLPAGSERVAGNRVSVSVPSSLLPSTGTGHESFAFAAGIPGSTVAEIASFAPEYVSAPIGQSGGRAR